MQFNQKNRVTAGSHEPFDSFSLTSETILRSPLFEESVAQNQTVIKARGFNVKKEGVDFSTQGSISNEKVASSPSFELRVVIMLDCVNGGFANEGDDILKISKMKGTPRAYGFDTVSSAHSVPNNRVTAESREPLGSFSSTSETILRFPLFEKNVAQNRTVIKTR